MNVAALFSKTIIKWLGSEQFQAWIWTCVVYTACLSRRRFLAKREKLSTRDIVCTACLSGWIFLAKREKLNTRDVVCTACLSGWIFLTKREKLNTRDVVYTACLSGWIFLAKRERLNTRDIVYTACLSESHWRKARRNVARKLVAGNKSTSVSFCMRCMVVPLLFMQHRSFLCFQFDRLSYAGSLFTNE